MSTLKVNAIKNLANQEPFGLTLMTQVTASGTAVDFTSIPSWAKRITVMFDGVSLSGTSQIIIQLGDSGGIETSGYVGGTATSASTTGYQVFLNLATRNATGIYTIINSNGNLWVGSGTTWNTTEVSNSAGSKILSATLDRIRITTVNGTDTFDAGTINIMYE